MEFPESLIRNTSSIVDEKYYEYAKIFDDDI